MNDRLAIGATGEFVWGGLDLKMGLPIMNGNGPTAGSLADFSPAFGGQQVLGAASGDLLNSMAPMIGSMTPQQMQGSSAVFDFSNDNDFTGQTNSTGFGARLGAT
ncbi:MAG: hypothetical protein R3E89_13615 [Thiolinea sp.]